MRVLEKDLINNLDGIEPLLIILINLKKNKIEDDENNK